MLTLNPMDQLEQTNAFAKDLTALIDRYGDEFEFSFASIVGTLFIAAQQIINEANENEH